MSWHWNCALLKASWDFCVKKNGNPPKPSDFVNALLWIWLRSDILPDHRHLRMHNFGLCRKKRLSISFPTCCFHGFFRPHFPPWSLEVFASSSAKHNASPNTCGQRMKPRGQPLPPIFVGLLRLYQFLHAGSWWSCFLSWRCWTSKHTSCQHVFSYQLKCQNLSTCTESTQYLLQYSII